MRTPRCHLGVFGVHQLTRGTQLALRTRVVATSFRAPLVEEDITPISVRGEPNGLAYDSRTDSLFAADDRSGAILRIESNIQARIAQIDAGGVVATHRLGGLTITPNGTLYAARLGHGRAGAIFCVEPNGATHEMLSLPSTPWRLGVSHDLEDDVLYTTQFMKSASGPFDGAVIAIRLATGAATRLLDGLVKPVGVVKLENRIVVTDAGQRSVFIVELRGGRPLTRVRLTSFDRPDSICACGPDSVLITCFDDGLRRGSVKKLWLDGRTREIAHGAWQPRGVATDGDRVFVSARRANQVLVFRL